MPHAGLMRRALPEADRADGRHCRTEAAHRTRRLAGRPVSLDAIAPAEGTPAVDVAAVRRQALLWYAQRVSAMVLGLCVVVHLAIIVYAVRGGLSAAEILGRTRGSWGFAAFYATFVAAAAVHAPIGIATVIAELRGGRGSLHAIVGQAVAVLILLLGLRAIYAVVAG